MNFASASRLGGLLSRDYSREFFRLLANYTNISASEAASRLDLHIKTAQDFLETLYEEGLVSKEEAYEKKRPYFRYGLKAEKLSIEVYFSDFSMKEKSRKVLEIRIREKKNSGVIFKSARSGDRISALHYFIGKGRKRKDKKIYLTERQGRFLYSLPFPTEEPLRVAEIMKKADIDEEGVPEIADMTEFLLNKGIIEERGRS